MSISNLGYLIIGASNLDQWIPYAEKLIGIRAERAKSGNAISLRLDAYQQRIRIVQSDEDDLLEAGWEFDSEPELDAYVDSLRVRGVEVSAGTPERCAERYVNKLYQCADPTGFVHGFYSGPKMAMAEDGFRQLAGAGGGFKTGRLGIGHFVVAARDFPATDAFYRDVLGFRVSDHASEEVAPGMVVKATFYHTKTGRHHSIAAGQIPGKKRLNHIMFEFNEMDDVGLAYDRFVKHDVPVIMAPGRHPNDKTFSFYVATPGGFGLELGWGGVVVGDDWTVKTYTQMSDWGHERFPRGRPE